MSARGDDRPYEPPASGPFEDRHPEIPRTGLLLMIVLTLLTLGLYIPYWFLSRRRAFNHLAPEGDSINLLTFAVAAASAVAWVLGFLSGLLFEASAPAAPLRHWTTAIDFGSRILTIILCFQIKSILEANHPERLSAIGTFFLSLFYLQYKINRQADPVAVEFTLR